MFDLQEDEKSVEKLDLKLSEQEFTDLSLQRPTSQPNEYVDFGASQTHQPNYVDDASNPYEDVDLTRPVEQEHNGKIVFTNQLYGVFEQAKGTGDYEKLQEEDA